MRVTDEVGLEERIDAVEGGLGVDAVEGRLGAREVRDTSLLVEVTNKVAVCIRVTTCDSRSTMSHSSGVALLYE